MVFVRTAGDEKKLPLIPVRPEPWSLWTAAVATGADGILVEVHHQPEKALSDGPQSIYPNQFAVMMDELQQIAPVVDRHLPRGIQVETATA